VRYYAQYLHLDADEAQRSPDPLFMHVAIIGLCEFFAAAQAMILPLAPKNLSAKELSQRYENFIRKLVLEGLRARMETRSGVTNDA
jgi:hypothetical protein